MGPRKTKRLKTNCQLKFTENIFDEPATIKCEIARVEDSKFFQILLPGAEAILTFRVTDAMQVLCEKKKVEAE